MGGEGKGTRTRVIQNILEKFQFDGETRRKFFSLLVEYAEEQQAGNPKKGNQDDHNQQ